MLNWEKVEALNSDNAAEIGWCQPLYSLHAHYLIMFNFFLKKTLPEQNNKRIVLALQSGLKSELTWALNALTLLSFKEKDEVRKDATPLAKIPGLLDALLQVVCFLISTTHYDSHATSVCSLLFILLSCRCWQYSVKQIDDWRDIALPRVLVKAPRVRPLGANAAVTGFGLEYEALNSNESFPHPR